VKRFSPAAAAPNLVAAAVVHRVRFVRRMREYRLVHRLIFDARDNAHFPSAGYAGLDVDTESAL